MRLTLTMRGGRVPTLTAPERRRITADAALGAAAEVRENFRRLAAASGSRHYWHGAAGSTEVQQGSAGTHATIIVRQRGVRLHYKGGEVRPTGRLSEVTGRPTKSLLIPFEDSPLRRRSTSLAGLNIPRERIFVITSRHGCPLLVAAESLRKKTRLLYLGKLVKKTTHRPRPEVLPTPAALRRAANHGAQQALKHIIARKK